jgi:5-methylcytosine-specific restriction endonuclease McrA
MITGIGLCAHCLTDDRYKDGKCKVCERARKSRWNTEHPEYAVEYRKRNKEKLYQRARQWAADHPERIFASAYKCRMQRLKQHTASALAWRAAHPEQYRQYQKDWWSRNKDRRIMYEQNRRSKKVASGTVVDKDLPRVLMALQQGRCVYCGVDITRKYHVDHIMPLSLGGEHQNENLQLLCPTCNLRKHNKHPEEFKKVRHPK